MNVDKSFFGCGLLLELIRFVNEKKNAVLIALDQFCFRHYLDRS